MDSLKYVLKCVHSKRQQNADTLFKYSSWLKEYFLGNITLILILRCCPYLSPGKKYFAVLMILLARLYFTLASRVLIKLFNLVLEYRNLHRNIPLPPVNSFPLCSFYIEMRPSVTLFRQSSSVLPSSFADNFHFLFYSLFWYKSFPQILFSYRYSFHNYISIKSWLPNLVT